MQQAETAPTHLAIRATDACLSCSNSVCNTRRRKQTISPTTHHYEFWSSRIQFPVYAKQTTRITWSHPVEDNYALPSRVRFGPPFEGCMQMSCKADRAWKCVMVPVFSVSKARNSFRNCARSCNIQATTRKAIAKLEDNVQEKKQWKPTNTS